ncbi:hypothetical protein V8F20_009621 [Naviculisporaceae sp. PSN 640]
MPADPALRILGYGYRSHLTVRRIMDSARLFGRVYTKKANHYGRRFACLQDRYSSALKETAREATIGKRFQHANTIFQAGHDGIIRDATAADAIEISLPKLLQYGLPALVVLDLTGPPTVNGYNILYVVICFSISTGLHTAIHPRYLQKRVLLSALFFGSFLSEHPSTRAIRFRIQSKMFSQTPTPLILPPTGLYNDTKR